MSRAMLLGLVALAAAGCATGTRSAAVYPISGGDGVSSAIVDAAQNCDSAAGWYDRAAGVCDSMGE